MKFACVTSGEMDNPAQLFSIAVKVERRPGSEYFDTLRILHSQFQDEISL